jgi:hypothetical protein
MKKFHRNLLITALVFIVVIVGYKMFPASAVADDQIVVTELPISGYSIEDDDADGIPDALPAELAPIETQVPMPTELPETLAPVADQPMPAAELVQNPVEKKETFTEYAPRRWSGELL